MNMAAKKKTSEFVRNLRYTPVHVRCSTLGHDKPFRIALSPRGERGDYKEVPISVAQDSMEFSANLDVLFEIIPKSEALELEKSYPAVGYNGGEQRTGLNLVNGELVEMPLNVDVSREAERDVARFTEDAKGVHRRPVGPNIVNMPGSDAALTLMAQDQIRAEGGDPAEAGSNEEAIKRALVQKVVNEQATDETIVVDRDITNPAARGTKRAPRKAPATGQPGRKPRNRAAKPE
jgi:hypothetical protein